MGVIDTAGEVIVTKTKKVTYRERSNQVRSSEPLPHAIWKGCGLKNLARLAQRPRERGKIDDSGSVTHCVTLEPRMERPGVE